MRDECSSGIFIFTADERFVRELASGETEEVWRPSENVVFELGAASILYENRIVIFKEKGVTFPSDFSDLGYPPLVTPSSPFMNRAGWTTRTLNCHDHTVQTRSLASFSVRVRTNRDGRTGHRFDSTTRSI